MGFRVRPKVNGRGRSWYCGRTPGPQEAEPRPWWARSALIQSQSGSAFRSGGCWAAARASEVQGRTVRSKCGRPSRRSASPSVGPADLGAGAVLLRHQVRRLEVVDRGREAADAGGERGVRVGLPRAAAEPLDAAEPRRDGEAHAQAREREAPLAVGDDLERQRQRRRPRRSRRRWRAARGRTPRRRRGCGRRACRPRLLDRERAVAHPVQAVRAPERPELLGPVIALVVVGRRAPDVEPRPDHRQRAEPAQHPGPRIELRAT